MENEFTDIKFISEQEVLIDGMNFYFGNLHAHTQYSDGTGTPVEGYTWARDIANFDFYAITDHCELLSTNEWNDIGHQTDLFNSDGEFVTIRGFEWSSNYTGHINVFNTSSYPGILSMVVLSKIFDWIDNNNGIAQFNHPGRTDNTYNDFWLSESVVDNVCLLESGNGIYGNNTNVYLPQYQVALDKGWKVAPANNQDNHSLSSNTHRTVILATALTRNNIFDAIKSRRVYSSDDPNIRIIFKLGELWMGGDTTISGKFQFTVDVIDNEPINKLQIITKNGIIAAQAVIPDGSMMVHWLPFLHADSPTFYYLRVLSLNILDSDTQIQVSVTAPIWINQRGQ